MRFAPTTLAAFVLMPLPSYANSSRKQNPKP
jgi:hypothetical protein